MIHPFRVRREISRDEDEENADGEAMVTYMPVPPGAYHKKDKHSGTNPHQCRVQSAEEHGFIIHSACQMGPENHGCGGFGSVHKTQFVLTRAQIDSCQPTVLAMDVELDDVDALCTGRPKDCGVSGAPGFPRTVSTNSGGSNGLSPSSEGDAVVTPPEVSVAERIAAMKHGAGIGADEPLAHSSEAPLGAKYGAGQPVYALKSGLADKEYVLEEREIWTTISAKKHPNINNLLGCFASVIPAHCTLVSQDEEEPKMKYFVERPSLTFITPWLSGDLHDRVHDGFTDDKLVFHANQMSREEMTRYAYDIAVALYHLHGLGLSHRDLKPANILVTENKTAKITDFGISAYPNITPTNTLGCNPRCVGMHHFPNHLGTAHYSSPQQNSYRLRELEIIPGPDEDPAFPRTRERRVQGQTINPQTGNYYQVCVALQSAEAVRREQRKWRKVIDSYVQPGPDFVFEGQLDGGCQASGKMDVWALGTLMLESLTGHSVYNNPKREHNIMRHWIKLAYRPFDGEMRKVWSQDGTFIEKTELGMRKQISTIRHALEYREDRRASALELAYRLAAVGLDTDEELKAKGIDPNKLGGNPKDLLDEDGQLPVRREALEWDNAVHAQWAYEHPNATLAELTQLHAADVAEYKKVEIEGPNTGLNLVSKAARSSPVRLVNNVENVEAVPRIAEVETRCSDGWMQTMFGVSWWNITGTIFR